MGRVTGAGMRIALAAAVTMLLAMAVTAATASAHTWSLEKDFAASPDGVTAAANPFPDSYGNSGVWAIGYGGGGTYTTGTEPLYSGLTNFTPAPSSDWHGWNGFYFNSEIEGWKDAAGYSEYPYIGNNAGAVQAGVWPAETVFAHPAPDLEIETPRDTIRWTSPITGTVSIEGTFASVDCSWTGDGIDYSVDSQPAGASTISHVTSGHVNNCYYGEGNSKTYTGTGIAVKQGDTYYFSVGDGGKNDYGYDSTAITLTISDGAAEPLSISAPARATAVYKHAIKAITVSGKDTDSDAVTLSAANVPAGLSFNTSTGVLSGSPTATPGRYAITFTANDGHGETVSTRMHLTIEQATCAIANKTALFATKPPVALKAKVTDPVTKAAVVGQSINFGAAAISSPGTGAGSWSATTGSTGVASAKAALGAGEVYEVAAYHEESPDYQSCATKANEIVTVAPATYVSSGAGTITTAGKETVTLGYIAVNEAAAGNPIYVKTPTGELRGATITSLSKPSATTATWTGTAGWNGENAEYTATASDPSTGADTLSITVTVGGETRWTSGGPIAVKGGDVRVK